MRLRLGIIGAMEEEVDTLKSEMEWLGTKTHAGMEFYIGRLEDIPVVIVRSGIGKVNAAVCAQILCDRFNVTHIINTGIAGSLSKELDIGDIVVSLGAIHHDFDCTAFGYAHCRIPGMPTVFDADTKLLQYAGKAAGLVRPGHAYCGLIASGDQFVSDSELKKKIVQQTLATCVEMEGAAIAQTAQLNDVPCVIIRTISDKAGDGAEECYEEFEVEAAERSAQVVVTLARMLKGEA